MQEPITHADSSKESRLFRRRAFLGGVASAGIAAAVIAIEKYLGRERPVDLAAEPLPPRKVEAVAAKPASTRPAVPEETAEQKVGRIYRTSVIPVMSDFDRRNAAAADRAMLTLHDRMQMHRAGVAPFTREIVSWKTRFGIIGRYSSDVWAKVRGRKEEAVKVRAYVDGKFRRYILSETSLQADVSAVVTQFAEDLQASRNVLYADLSLPLARIRVAVPSASAKVDRFQEQVRSAAGAMVQGMSLDTVVAGLAAVAGGWVATDVAQMITARVVTQVLTQVGTAMAAEGIEAGGATLGSAAVGGGGGSLAGPVGTIVGIGVGLIVGAIIDWRMSKKFEAKVSRQCEAFIDTVEARLRDGSRQSPGLNRILRDAVDLAGRVQLQAVRNALRETYA